MTGYMLYFCIETRYSKVSLLNITLVLICSHHHLIITSLSHDYHLFICPIIITLVQEMKQISLFIQKQNDEIYHPQGVHLIEPMLRGDNFNIVTTKSLFGCNSPQDQLIDILNIL